MKLVSWNIRGLGSKLKVTLLRKLLRVHRVDLFRFVGAAKNSGGLISIWNSKAFKLENCTIMKEVILLEGRFITCDFAYSMVNVYAPCEVIDKRILWHILSNLKICSQGIWLIGGDFNIVRESRERRCCKLKPYGSKEFNSFIETCKLVDVSLTTKYTLGTGLKTRGPGSTKFFWMKIGRWQIWSSLYGA
ncbi:hypothetical protein GQ457_01G012240 [Hibiscus cannabinus]